MALVVRAGVSAPVLFSAAFCLLCPKLQGSGGRYRERISMQVRFPQFMQELGPVCVCSLSSQLMLGGFTAGQFLSKAASEISVYLTGLIDSALKSTDRLRA